MPTRKRLRRAEYDPDIEPSGTPPKKSARHATKAVSSGDGSDNDRSAEEILSDAALIQEVLKMVEKPKAELMILQLMRKYKFDFARLKELLSQHGLNVSFSKVQYVDIASLVGLDPYVEGDDIPTFEMFHARLPNAIFLLIIDDIEMFGTQYGPMNKHVNEGARSRYLSAYFNRTVRLFSGLLFNTPETIMNRRLTTQGRIEYQYKTYGGITVVFIEVKLEIGSSTERLNFVAQVIAECDACAWVNYQMGYDVPIMAVLCDGKTFFFYKFVDKRPANGSPQVFMGEFPNGDRGMSVDDISVQGANDPQTFYRKLRMTCDALYYVFLSGYKSGLEAYWKRSVEKGKAQGKGRNSTPGWHKAIVQAKKALEEAVSAWNLYNEGKLDESDDSGERAAQFLAESVEIAPWAKTRILPNRPEGVERI